MAAIWTRVIAGFFIFGAGASAIFIRVADGQTGSVGNKTVWVREHRRVERKEAPGRRVGLSTLKGATLYFGPNVNTKRAVPLLVHFHGAPWLIEQHIAQHLPRAALITVQLGAGSSVYGRPFAEEKLFADLIAEAERTLGTKHGWSSITLSGFSAGYGAIRSILRHPAHFESVDGVLLLDGFHASYEPEGKALAEDGEVSGRDIDSYVAFAREAVKRRKQFVITHSQIHPGTYASTTECTNELLGKLGLRRQASTETGPMGMQQLSKTGKGTLRIFGYAGETAPDHIDHLHAMPYWFRFLGVR
jgi:hypothetical protein